MYLLPTQLISSLVNEYCIQLLNSQDIDTLHQELPWLFLLTAF
jgi:hypothetical protein